MTYKLPRELIYDYFFDAFEDEHKAATLVGILEEAFGSIDKRACEAAATVSSFEQMAETLEGKIQQGIESKYLLTEENLKSGIEEKFTFEVQKNEGKIADLENDLNLFKNDLKSKFQAEMRSELRSQLKNDLKSDLKGDLENELRKNLKNDLKNDLSNGLSSLKSNLDESLTGKLKEFSEGINSLKKELDRAQTQKEFLIEKEQTEQKIKKIKEEKVEQKTENAGSSFLVNKIAEINEKNKSRKKEKEKAEESAIKTVEIEQKVKEENKDNGKKRFNFKQFRIPLSAHVKLDLLIFLVTIFGTALNPNFWNLIKFILHR